MTYNVFGGTLSLTSSINLLIELLIIVGEFLEKLWKGWGQETVG